MDEQRNININRLDFKLKKLLMGLKGKKAHMDICGAETSVLRK